MNDFDYDVLQKKRIAAGARHRVNGSKSKYCGLPSDHLSPAELKKRSGECRSFRMDEPCTWSDFQSMPKDLKKEYVGRLRDLYGANNAMLSELWHVSQPTVLKAMRDADIPNGGVNRSRMPAEESEMVTAKWNAFCNGVVGGKAKEDNTVPAAAESETDTVDEPDVPAVEEPVPQEAPSPAMCVRRQTMELEGTVTAESLARALARLTLPGEHCRIRIEVEAL
jgi:hypothetical protein